MAMRESRNEPQTVADAGPLSVQATAMTYAAIVMSQVGAGLAWRTNRRSIVDVGLLSNWLFLLVWPSIVLGAEEIRKRFIRRRP